MELKVNEVAIPERIDFNYEELKQELTEKVSMYETMVYTDDQIKEAKADKASLNKLKKALNDERLRREREYMKPFNEFKEQINEIIAIIDKPIAVIDKQVKEAEEQKKQEKAQKIEELFKDMQAPDWVELKAIYNPKWLNASFSMKAVKEELVEKLDKINNDLDTLSNLPEFGFEATEVYKSSLDINKAVNEGKRLADIQKRKEEQERLKAEAVAKAKEEALAKAEEEAARREHPSDADMMNICGMGPDPAHSQSEPEPIEAQWISFSAKLTVAQARELKEFFDSRSIEFKAI